MIETVLVMLYGSIVIADGFLVNNMLALAFAELRERGIRKSLGEVYFWLSVNHAAQALFIGIICAYRAHNAVLYGEVVTRYWWLLLFCFGGLLVTKAGFNWASTLTAKHGRFWWWLFVALTISWWAIVIFAL